MEWDKIQSKYAREAQQLKRVLGIYNYKEREAVETDKKLRDFLIFELREIKVVLTNLMSIDHQETDKAAETLEKIRDDIDLAITEIQSLSFWKFPDREDSLEKILKADIVLLNNMDLLKKSAGQMHSQIINSESHSSFPAKVENLRKTLSDSRAIFLERSEIIKLRK